MTRRTFSPANDSGGRAAAPDADEAFRSKAREILADGRRVSAGYLHFIALDEIRERLGARWEAVKDRVHDYTAKLLVKSLSPQDIWFRHGDHGYILLFARLEMTEAKLLCAHIAETLQTALLGDGDTKTITVRTAVLEVDGSIAVHTTRLAELLGEAASRAGAPCAPHPVAAGRHAGGYGHAAEDFTPRILFRPIFDVRNKVISTHICRPDADTQRYLTAPVPNPDEHAAACFALDIQALSEAVEVYQELFANRFRYAQVLPVHVGSLSTTRRRGEYIERCRAIPRHLLPFLAFELTGLPRGIPSSRLGELVGALRPFGRGVFIMGGEESAADLAIYQGAGVIGVGLALDRRHDDARCIERLQAFCGLVRRAGLFSYIDGVRDAALLYAAEAAGAAYLCGSAIGPDSEVPEHMQRSSEQELLERSSRKAGSAGVHPVWG